MDGPGPITRRERQQRTRDALLAAARTAFAQVGYHAANLEEIARAAGFTKGAVYSNFVNKAELFLAVVDQNVESARSELKSAFEPSLSVLSEPAEVSDAIKGFALATLEFVAVAARDKALDTEMGKRVSQLIDSYTEVARSARADDEQFDDRELGALMTALEQGAALITLAGTAEISQQLLKAGLSRLLRPTDGPGEDPTIRNRASQILDPLGRE